MQKRFLFNNKIINNIDEVENKTVQIRDNELDNASLSLIDVYCSKDCHGKKRHDYTIERIKIYNEIFQRYPEYSGAWENKYRLPDGSLVSIIFDVTKK